MDKNITICGGGISLAHKANYKLIRIIMSALLVFITGILIFVLVQAVHIIGPNENISAEFYYIDSVDLKMKPEVKKVKTDDSLLMIKNILEELKKGPKEDGLNSSVPIDVLFQEVKLEDGTVIVDVSKEYYNMKIGQELVCRASIVWTLTALNFVDYVEITVDGKELTRTDGEPLGLMNRENVVIDAQISPESKRYETVKLYFANREKTELVVEERKIEVSHNQPREKYVMQQLISGPESNELVATIPDSTKLKDITTTEDGICYVNLSADFLDQQDAGTQTELLAVNSIVYSLTGLSNIEKVQFLIEGEKIDESRGHLDFSKPFESGVDIEVQKED